MTEVTATEAARNFADLLDGVEHRGERYTILRRGRAVAHLEPMARGRGADVKELLRRHGRDSAWPSDVDSVRQLLEIEDRT